MTESGPESERGLPLVERRRLLGGVPIRVILPNLVTLVALCIGLTAIRFAVEGRFEAAVFSIIGAAVLDGVDGRLARAIKGTSRFGAEFDSLADFVDFGVAPAILLYVWVLNQAGGVGWFAALVFAIACGLRLARFNVMNEDPDRPAWHGKFFTGMPAPAGALVGMLPLYAHLLGLPVDPAYVAFEAAFVLLVAFLMASRIPHFSGKGLDRVPREYVILLLFVVTVLLGGLATFPIHMLAGLTILYLALIPFSIRHYRTLQRAEDEKAGVEQVDRGAAI